MTEARYHELLGQMLDGSLSGAEADELRDGLAVDPARLRDLREHLMLWDLWSQEHTPQRGAEAFTQAFQLRLHAEASGSPAPSSSIGSEVTGTVLATQPSPGLRRWRIGLVAVAAAAALVLFAVTLAVRGTRLDRERTVVDNHLVWVRGEAVCRTASCTSRARVASPSGSAKGTARRSSS